MGTLNSSDLRVGGKFMVDGDPCLVLYIPPRVLLRFLFENVLHQAQGS